MLWSFLEWIRNKSLKCSRRQTRPPYCTETESCDLLSDDCRCDLRSKSILIVSTRSTSFCRRRSFCDDSRFCCHTKTYWYRSFRCTVVYGRWFCHWSCDCWSRACYLYGSDWLWNTLPFLSCPGLSLYRKMMTFLCIFCFRLFESFFCSLSKHIMSIIAPTDEERSKVIFWFNLTRRNWKSRCSKDQEKYCNKNNTEIFHVWIYLKIMHL